MHHTDVSVFMPVYNAARTLRETLDSLRRQTLNHFELVVVDDGSEDDSAAIIKGLWPPERLRLLRQEHAGVDAASAYALAACSTPLVARMDADDIALPRRLELQRTYLHQYPRCAAVGALVETFGGAPKRAKDGARHFYDAWLNSLITPAEHWRDLFVECPLAHPSTMLRRDAVLAVGGYQVVPWAEDYDLFLRLALAGFDLAKVNTVLLRWRDSSTRYSRTDPHCSPHAFIRCKAHYLARHPLKDVDAVRLWAGAGHGRAWFDALKAEGIEVECFIDIDPRKVGGQRRGRPVYSPVGQESDMRRPVLAAVGVLGAREQIRAQWCALGFTEGVDAWAVA